MEKTNKKHDGIKSRKFIAAALMQAVATLAWLLLDNKIDAAQWITFTQSNMAIFAIGSVAEKFGK